MNYRHSLTLTPTSEPTELMRVIESLSRETYLSIRNKYAPTFKRLYEPEIKEFFQWIRANVVVENKVCMYLCCSLWFDVWTRGVWMNDENIAWMMVWCMDG